MVQIKLTHKTYNWDPYKYTPKRKDRLIPRTLKELKTLNMADRQIGPQKGFLPETRDCE